MFLFFLYEEVLLSLLSSNGQPASFACLLFSSLSAGCLTTLLLFLIPSKKFVFASRILLLSLIPVLYLAEFMCKTFFGTFYEIGYMIRMTGSVAGQFSGEALGVLAGNWYIIPVAYFPLIFFLLFHRLSPKFLTEFREKHPAVFERNPFSRSSLLPALLLGAVLFHGLTNFSCQTLSHDTYGVQFSANRAIPRFGLLTSVRLETRYALLGQPDAAETLTNLALPAAAIPETQAETQPAESIPETQDAPASKNPAQKPETEKTSEAETAETEAEAAQIDYGYNRLDIDFETLVAGETDETLQTMHHFFASLTPTRQNEYTGRFAGKNLIMLTAEAFSPYVIDPELTPTLYRLSREGFVFNHYYQPAWFQSTTGGEFACMTGLIPTWVNGQLSFTASAADAMPFALGNQFAALGYRTLAYHNSDYTYYNRDRTHPNLGYEYHGIGNGLDIPVGDWPYSDLDMMKATVPDYLKTYREDGTPFHVYYMTVSGHCNYSWEYNAMSRKNRDAVSHLNYSETVKAYLACNLELEYALTYLVEELEKAGALDDTVIVLSADHYPYALTQNSPVDYYNELSGKQDSEDYISRYENTLILWCGDMEEPVEVNTPCSSLDIVPTLSNLFGLPYDSRLLAGTDLLAPHSDPTVPSFHMPLVIFPDGGFGTGWSTIAGTYEAKTQTFIPNEGYAVGNDFVSSVSAIAEAKYLNSRLIIAEDYYRVAVP
ncbi:MAG: LTA synthase family protein [Lachnospiraceae bacterium]|nr:LTA synthase family protein [Lachnospiraceae bacterium]